MVKSYCDRCHLVLNYYILHTSKYFLCSSRRPTLTTAAAAAAVAVATAVPTPLMSLLRMPAQYIRAAAMLLCLPKHQGISTGTISPRYLVSDILTFRSAKIQFVQTLFDIFFHFITEVTIFFKRKKLSTPSRNKILHQNKLYDYVMWPIATKKSRDKTSFPVKRRVKNGKSSTPSRPNIFTTKQVA